MGRSKRYWWEDYLAEVFWCEITDREDIGTDLNCPQTDESGGHYWSYEIINKISPGDIVFHYSTTEKAIVGASIAKGTAREGTISWAAHGSVGRSKRGKRKARPAWRLGLSSFTRAMTPLTLKMVQKDEKWLRAWISARRGEGPACAPFQAYPGRIRGSQGYLTKMPLDFVQRWPQLRALASELSSHVRFLHQTVGLGGDPEAAIIEFAEEVRSKGKGQGFRGSPALRKAVEEYAVGKAKGHFEALGYTVAVVGKPYDLRCLKGSEVLYVEVKGTTSEGKMVLLTPNEVAFAREHKETMALFVVSSAEASREDETKISGGKISVVQPWDIDAGVLEPIGYEYTREL